MKKFILIILLLNLTLYSQINNEIGSINMKDSSILTGKINYENDKLTIKTDNKENIIINQSNIENITLSNGAIFKIIEVEIDVNKFSINRNCNDSEIQLRKYKLISKLLISGEVNLYKTEFKSNSIYIVENKENFSALINSKCSVSEDRIKKYNEEFKKTLYDLFKDKIFELNEFLILKFDDKSILNFIKKINQIEKSNFEDYTNIKSQKSFFIAPLLGYRIQSYRLDLINDIDFNDSFNNLNIGVDFSYYINSKRSFGLFLRSNFEKINVDNSKTKKNNELTVVRYNHEKVVLNANLFTISLGPRFNIFNKNAFKVSTDFGVDFNQPIGKNNYSFYKTLNLQPTYDFTESNLRFSKTIESSINYSLGLSTIYNKKYTFEIRYYTERDLGNMDSTGRTFTPFFNNSIAFNLMYIF